MMWNANSLLSGSRELALAYLLDNNSVDVMVVTETEIPDLSAPFATAGYVTFFLLVRAKEKTRTIMLVRASLATQAGVQVRPDMKIATFQTVLNAHKRLGQSHGAVTIGGIYRQWSHMGNLLTADEERV
jgi:hypothetical protein